MRASVLFVSACLLMPLAWAGSADEPEITDAAADVVTSAGAPACAPTECQSAPRFIDLVKAWVEQSQDKLLFRIQVAGNHNANAYGEAEYMVFFSIGGTSYEAGFVAGRSSTTAGDDSETPVGVADAASFEEDHVLVEVPLAAVGAQGGGVLTEFYARTTIDLADQSDDSMHDRAPDSGFGLDFVIEGGAAEVVPVYENVTGAFDHAFLANETTDAAFVINWTGPAHATMDLRIQGEGDVNVTVLDPSGATQFACTCNGSTNESADFEAEEGIWRVHLNYTAFAGNASLRLYETLADPDPIVDPDGNATDDGNATGGNATSAPSADSPLPLPLAVVALAAVLARRRR